MSTPQFRNVALERKRKNRKKGDRYGGGGSPGWVIIVLLNLEKVRTFTDKQGLARTLRLECFEGGLFFGR